MDVGEEGAEVRGGWERRGLPAEGGRGEDSGGGWGGLQQRGGEEGGKEGGRPKGARTRIIRTTQASLIVRSWLLLSCQRVGF